MKHDRDLNAPPKPIDRDKLIAALGTVLDASPSDLFALFALKPVIQDEQE